MKLNKKNLPKMSAKQKKIYKENLVRVAAYCKARSEWQKALKNGEVDKNLTLSEFRTAKAVNKSLKKIKIKRSDLENMQKAHDSALEDNVLITKLQKMIDEIKGSQKKHSTLLETINKLMG